MIKTKIKDRKKVKIKYFDYGKIADWGTPKTYSKRKYFINYCEWIWKQKNKPNLVLIDGRFRICCFLNSLIKAKPETKIIFDDYIERPLYHVVEEFIKPKIINNRQALFIVPNKNQLNLDEIKKEIKKFQYVII